MTKQQAMAKVYKAYLSHHQWPDDESAAQVGKATREALKIDGVTISDITEQNRAAYDRAMSRYY